MVKITMALLQWRYYILVHCATPVKFVRRKLATSSQNILTGNQILTFLLEVLPTERCSHMDMWNFITMKLTMSNLLVLLP